MSRRIGTFVQVFTNTAQCPEHSHLSFTRSSGGSEMPSSTRECGQLRWSRCNCIHCWCCTTAYGSTGEWQAGHGANFWEGKRASPGLDFWLKFTKKGGEARFHSVDLNRGITRKLLWNQNDPLKFKMQFYYNTRWNILENSEPDL